MKNIVKICITLMMILMMTVPTFAATADFVPSIDEKPEIDLDISDKDDKDDYDGEIDGEDDQRGEAGQNGGAGENDGTGENVPSTGDDTNVVLWAGLGVAAAAGLVIVLRGRHCEKY